MKKNGIICAAVGAVLLAVSPASAFWEKLRGQPALAADEYFTGVNIWYDDDKPIQSTNYHVGNRIPIGSRVSDLAVGQDTITFLYKGTRYNIQHNKKHTLVSTTGLKDRTFSKINPLETPSYKALTKAEKDSIAAGTVDIGMSREAVILALGYPPEHKTPSLQQNIWTYWRNRFLDFRVVFEDNRVVRIK